MASRYRIESTVPDDEGKFYEDTDSGSRVRQIAKRLSRTGGIVTITDLMKNVVTTYDPRPAAAAPQSAPTEKD